MYYTFKLSNKSFMRLTLLSQMLGTFLIQLIGKRKEAIKLLKPKRILLRVTNLGSLKMKSKIKIARSNSEQFYRTSRKESPLFKEGLQAGLCYSSIEKSTLGAFLTLPPRSK